MKQNFRAVMTAIPYVNDKPHLGHALLFTYADVLARFWRSQSGLDKFFTNQLSLKELLATKDDSDRVFFSAGTDEHGSKIVERARSKGQDPQVFVDRMSDQFQQALKELNISYNRDQFIRTSSTNHQRRVRTIWRQITQAGFIYQDSYRGSYCIGCEAYKTKTVVLATGGVCPDHDRPYQDLQEVNYFFRLTDFKDQIRDRINDDLIILPPGLKAEVLTSLDDLKDISISRPKTSVDWGITVPGDDSQVIYVWFDALLNYITVLGYPDDRANFDNFWPAEVQVLGRDILRFHALYWPAILLALELPLPKKLYVHGLVTVGGQKMSKTLGNSIDPLKLVGQSSLDSFRYYFLSQMSAYDNGDFSYQKYITAHNQQLVNDLGNLIYRIYKLLGRDEQPVTPDLNFYCRDLVRDWGPVWINYQQLLTNCRFDRALELVWQQVRSLNQSLEKTAPWKLTDQAKYQQILATIINDLRLVGLLLKPFLPQVAKTIKTTFGDSLADLPQPPITRIETLKPR